MRSFVSRLGGTLLLLTRPMISVSFVLHHDCVSRNTRSFHNVCQMGASAADVNSGRVSVARGTESFDITYKVYRPKSLSSRQAAPIVALHGGPSLPSDYLEPLVDVIPYRSIVLYDQIGCGDSDEPEQKELYSVEAAIDDLEMLLKTLGVRRFHLYGHSFGGMLAYEYIKRVAERKANTDEMGDDDEDGCLSVVFSSACTSIPVMEAEWNRLLADLPPGNVFSVNDRFREAHQCRTAEIPEPLARAYSKVGKMWVGLDAVSEYELTPASDSAARMPSALLLRGEFDHCTDECQKDWDTLINHKFLRRKVLENCSHHGLLENGSMYGDVLHSFFSEYD